MAKNKEVKPKKELTPEEIKQKQIDRLDTGNVKLMGKDLEDYLKAPDILAEDTTEIPAGYKKCGSCKQVKKFYLFNKNSSSKNGCTGNCADCQRESAKKSYKKTKKKRNYAAYYQENKEAKQEAARKYYEEHKDELDAKHKKYVSSSKGRKVMQRARAKRNEALEKTKGIYYDKDILIDRDKNEDGQVLCYLCNQPIDLEHPVHIDHVIGLAIGGLNCLSNTALVHSRCNLTKTKDCREVTADVVDAIAERTQKYIDEHPEILERD